MIGYQIDTSRKVLQDLPLPALNSSLDLEHFTEILHLKYKTVQQENAPHLLISLKTEIINSVKIESIKPALSNMMSIHEITKLIYGKLWNIDHNNQDCIKYIREF